MCATHSQSICTHDGRKHLIGVHIPGHGCCLGTNKHRGQEGRLPVRLVFVVLFLLCLVPPYLEGACQGLPSLHAGQHAMLILDWRAEGLRHCNILLMIPVILVCTCQLLVHSATSLQQFHWVRHNDDSKSPNLVQAVTHRMYDQERE